MHKIYKLGQMNHTPFAIHTGNVFLFYAITSECHEQLQWPMRTEVDKTVWAASRQT